MTDETVTSAAALGVEQTPRVVPAGGAPALRLRGIGKEYPGVVALGGVDLDIAVGEVHGLVGENGAGKSTLLKILTGAHTPTAGTIELFGEPVELSDPATARKLGVTAVYQELTVIGTLSAAANVFLGQERHRGPLQDRAAERGRFLELCRMMDVELSPSARAGSLSIADQQTLEIMRGIESAARVLVLDEPTASLALHEREALYKVVASLRAHGVTIVLISHDLDEVLAMCDTVTVLREGRKVATEPSASWTKQTLIAAMLGEDVSLQASHRRTAGDELLHAEVIDVPGVLADVSLTVRAGEILGIAGLVGSGRTELLRALAGLDPASTGRLRIAGEDVSWPRSPRAALRLGIALAPEDRKHQGLVLGMPAYDNVNLTSLGKVAVSSVLLRRREVERAHALGERVRLQRGAERRTTRLLSGGNQQKVVLAKWIDRDVRVLLVDEPTRGIDIGAKAEVFALLDSLASQGMGIVMVSSELEEVVAHSDRVIALGGGRVIGEYEGARLTQASLMASLFQENR
ncbi:MAG: sugar ABC transporter ATP-binding protein [Thermoleophilia bacterium]